MKQSECPIHHNAVSQTFFKVGQASWVDFYEDPSVRFEIMSHDQQTEVLTGIRGHFFLIRSAEA